MVYSNDVVIKTAFAVGMSLKIEHQEDIGSARGASTIFYDDILVGAGAWILGSSRLVRRVRIGADTVAVTLLRDGLRVVGVPARYLTRGDES